MVNANRSLFARLECSLQMPLFRVYILVTWLIKKLISLLCDFSNNSRPSVAPPQHCPNMHFQKTTRCFSSRLLLHDIHMSIPAAVRKKKLRSLLHLFPLPCLFLWKISLSFTHAMGTRKRSFPIKEVPNQGSWLAPSRSPSFPTETSQSSAPCDWN